MTRLSPVSDTTISHPLYQQDRALINIMLAKPQPDEDALTTAGRLFLRYGGFPGAYDLKSDLSKCLDQWGMTRDELNTQCFKIWNSGWRPGQVVAELTVGSGADTE